MRFVLVQCARVPEWALAHEAGWDQWRATHVRDDGRAIDILLWAVCQTDAQNKILMKYPSATFAGATLH